MTLLIIYACSVALMALLIRIEGLRTGGLRYLDRSAALVACFLWPAALVMFVLAISAAALEWAFFSPPEDER